MEILAPPDSLASLMTEDPFCAQEGVQTLQSARHFYSLTRIVGDLGMHLEELGLPYALASDLLIRNIPLKEGVSPDIALWPGHLDLKGGQYHSLTLSADLCPALILEVVSENTFEADADIKYEIYRLAGIGEYWLYDPDGYAGVEPLRGWRWVEGEYVPIPGRERMVAGETTTLYASAVLRTDWGLTTDAVLRLWDPQRQEWYRTTVAAQRQIKARAEQAEAKVEQERIQTQRERARAEQAEAKVGQERIQTQRERARAEQAEAKVGQERIQTQRERARAEQAEAKVEQGQIRAEQMEAELVRLRAQLQARTDPD